MNGLDLSQVKNCVITPTLKSLSLFSPAALNLVAGTGLVESGYRYLRQLGTGPARGCWQMEPATHDDCWNNFIHYRPELAHQLGAIAGTDVPEAGIMEGNFYYAAAMCRVLYLRAADPLPVATDASALSAYHKRFYNTAQGAADAARNAPLFQRAIDA